MKGVGINFDDASLKFKPTKMILAQPNALDSLCFVCNLIANCFKGGLGLKGPLAYFCNIFKGQLTLAFPMEVMPSPLYVFVLSSDT